MIDPLGICDGRTIPQTGFILVQRRYKDRTGEVYHIAYNPAHEWFYFPQMKRHEAMVFKVFDTDQSVPTKFTAHSAFDDPNTPPERAAAREHRDADLRVLGLRLDARRSTVIPDGASADPESELRALNDARMRERAMSASLAPAIGALIAVSAPGRGVSR